MPGQALQRQPAWHCFRWQRRWQPCCREAAWLQLGRSVSLANAKKGIYSSDVGCYVGRSSMKDNQARVRWGNCN